MAFILRGNSKVNMGVYVHMYIPGYVRACVHGCIRNIIVAKKTILISLSCT